MTKITIDRATVEQALEALDEIIDADDWLRTSKARVALRQALQQPNEFTPDWDQIKPFNDRIAELERVARQAFDALKAMRQSKRDAYTMADDAIDTLRQALEQDVALIDEGNKEAQQRPQNCGTGYCSCIECVMKPAQQQEPVIDKSAAIRIATALGWEPKKEWVGLTDEEVDELQSGLSASHADVRAIEAKLKEKNFG